MCPVMKLKHINPHAPEVKMPFESRLDFAQKRLSMKTDDIRVWMAVSYSSYPGFPYEKDLRG